MVIFIGNIRTKDIKQAAEQLVEMYPDRFTRDFEENKQTMTELKITIGTKLMRNKVAGYITRLKVRKNH